METTIPEKKSSFATEPIGKLIVRFAIPSVIALLVNSLYNIVDQIFIGWGVGYLGNGATNIVFPITIIALALSMMIGNGGAAYLRRGRGKGSPERRGKRNYTVRSCKHNSGHCIYYFYRSPADAVWRHRNSPPLCA